MISKLHIIVDNLAIAQIMSFYNNVGLKFPHNNTGDVIEKYIDNAINSIYSLNNDKLLQEPYLNRWAGYKRITLGYWNLAVVVDGNTFYVKDACHRQNMTNNPEIEESEDIPYNNPRINKVDFPLHLPNGFYWIRAKIDGDWYSVRKITESEYQRGCIDKDFAIKLAEKYYAKELAENRFDLDNFIRQGPKI